MGTTSRAGEERRLSDESHDTSDQRATVPQAAQMLGISEGAVRKRVERGKMRAERDQAGRLIVYLEGATPTTDTTRDRPRQSRDDRYTHSLEEQVEYLRQQLDQEREARTEERRRHDTLMAQLTQANAALAARIPELEAPAPQEARESPDSPGPSETPAPSPGDAQEATERPQPSDTPRSWWRRMFGGGG